MSSPIKIFFDTWGIYDLVLDCNYMFHDEIFRDVARLFQERFHGRPFSILDLGCGSARHLAAVLHGCRPARYLGYDLSDVALDRARANLTHLDGTVELRQADLREALAAGQDRFDVIFSSYAVHHLKTSEKGEFFALAHQRLLEDGILLLVDTAQEEYEERESSLAAYCQWIASGWKQLPPEARELVFEHIRSADYPEKSSTLHQLAERAGFTHCQDVNAFGWHHIWCFGKIPSAQPAASDDERTRAH